MTNVTSITHKIEAKQQAEAEQMASDIIAQGFDTPLPELDRWVIGQVLNECCFHTGTVFLETCEFDEQTESYKDSYKIEKCEIAQIYQALHHRWASYQINEEKGLLRVDFDGDSYYYTLIVTDMEKLKKVMPALQDETGTNQAAHQQYLREAFPFFDQMRSQFKNQLTNQNPDQ